MERDAAFWREQAEYLAEELSATQCNLAAISINSKAQMRKAVSQEQVRIANVLAAYAIALVQP